MTPEEQEQKFEKIKLYILDELVPDGYGTGVTTSDAIFLLQQIDSLKAEKEKHEDVFRIMIGSEFNIHELKKLAWDTIYPKFGEKQP